MNALTLLPADVGLVLLAGLASLLLAGRPRPADSLLCLLVLSGSPFVSLATRR